MRLGKLAGEAILVVEEGAISIARASGGRFGPSIDGIYDEWEAFADWAVSALEDQAIAGLVTPFDPLELEAPVQRPRQIFAIGLNYAAHAEETGYAGSREFVVFTKFASSLAGPQSTVALPTETVDWEVEVVAIIGREARDVTIEDAWDHVAGLSLGQDLSERTMQMRGRSPQFSLAKSYPAFSPIGPVVVSLDDIADRDAIEFGCDVDGEVMQAGNTRNLLFSIPEIVSRLSQVVTLTPGDVIFTGTPDGVGLGRIPQVYLKPGQVLTSRADGIGEIRTVCEGAL